MAAIWGRFKSLGAAVLVVLVVGCAAPSPPPSPSGSALPGASPTAAASSNLDASPSPGDASAEVLGMPVHTVSEVVAMQDAGSLNGRAVAVRGWWTNEPPVPCPPPSSNQPALERWCTSPVLTETDQHLLGADGYTWTSPVAPFIEPRVVTDSVGTDGLYAPLPGVQDWNRAPRRVVLIGHEGDPRTWQCRAPDRQGCETAFVLDRVVSVEATLIDPAPQQSDVAPLKTAAAVQAILVAALPGAQLVSLVPVNTADAPAIDPRFRIGIDGVAWIARMAVEPAGSDGTTSMNEVAVSDASGTVLQQLAFPASFSEPFAVLRLNMAGASGGGQEATFYGLDGGNGVPILAGSLNWQTPAATIEPGTYTLRAWVGPYQSRPDGKRRGECHMQVVAGAGAELGYTATWPNKTAACHWSTTPPNRY